MQDQGRPGPSQASTSMTPSQAAVPLHLALTWLAVKALPSAHGPGVSEQVYSSTFVAAILEVISIQVLELTDEPLSFVELLHKTDGLVRKETANVAKQNLKLQSRGQKVTDARREAEVFDSWMTDFADNFGTVADGCGFMDHIESQVRQRMNETDDEDLPESLEPIERHSLLGVFVRRLILTLRRLSFEETSQVAKQVGQWCGTMSTDGRFHTFNLNRRRAMKDNLENRTRAMQEYELAANCGDHTKALDALRRFYDYKPAIHGRNSHHHAALNLATFYFNTNSMIAAKSAIEEAIRVARGQGDKGCLQQCQVLARRIETEMNSTSYSLGEMPRLTPMVIPSARLLESASPLDELWAIKPATDMGEPAHVAMQRVWRALSRHENGASKYENKDTRDSWAAKYDFDVGAWHAAQAGLWEMIGSDALVELHEDMVMDRAQDGRDGRLTVTLAKAARAVRRGCTDEALAILFDTSTIQGISMADYHRWSRAVWSTLRVQLKHSDNDEAQKTLDSLEPSRELSGRFGVGGNVRELGHVSEVPDRQGLVLAQDQVNDQLRKGRKILDAGTPPHVVMPELMSAIHLASSLSLWPSYRYGVVLLSMLMLEMEGANLAGKARDQVNGIRDQIVASDDAELMVMADTVLGEAETMIAMEGDISFDTAKAHLRSALQRAMELKSKDSILRLTTDLALIAHLDGGEVRERDELASLWSRERDGDQVRLTAERDEVRRVGQLVRLVGVRVAEGWQSAPAPLEPTHVGLSL